ncbi:MAG: beta-galactosidase trimerization domain-containing protein [Candidatus Brocadiia bacterium]
MKRSIAVLWTIVVLALVTQKGVTAKPKKSREKSIVHLRARVKTLKPEQPALINWRWGGEGLGGDVHSGMLTRELPNAPDKSSVLKMEDDADAEAIPLEEDKGPDDRIIVEGDTYTYHYLKPGVWSRFWPVSTFGRTRGRLFVTFTLEGHGTGRRIKDTELELEFAYEDKTVKRFTVQGPDGPTFGVVIPFYRLAKDGSPTPAFTEELGSLRQYAEHKINVLKAEPWADKPVPKRYAFVTDCFGYKPGSGYKCRTADKKTMLAEYKVLRLMGVNGLRGCPQFVTEMLRNKEGLPAEFSRVKLARLIGYPIPTVHYADGRAPRRSPGDGCPHRPDNKKAIQKRVDSAVKRLMENTRDLPVEEIWGLTVDEIGTVFDRAPERKAHMGACPYCREAFREMIRRDGKTPADFGADDWEPIRAVYGYWAKTFWESKRILEERVRKLKKATEGELKGTLGLEGKKGDERADDILGDLDEKKARPDKDTAQALLEARNRLKALIWNSKILYVPEEKRERKVSDEGWQRLTYYSRRFNCTSAAQLFEPLRLALKQQNEKKRQVLAHDEVNSPVARQPWVYSYALRGNNFLMGGHSLDFFNFYRYADNAFVYETSNRAPRVWQWDSYLCDVGRSLRLRMGKKFGIYVKPHRGAPPQRALSAIARGARMIYWYTYGPDWAKGDTFGGRLGTLNQIGKFARLVAETEDVTYGAKWAVKPEVAVVRARTSEFFAGSASWENGKWIWTALMHAHIPVDALDEVMLLREDLSRYRIIYISGSHLRRDVAKKLVQYVRNGGTLYTSGRGLARDEASQPLDILRPVLGLEKRGEMHRWARVPRYGATSLRNFRRIKDPPGKKASVQGKEKFGGPLKLAVGREILHPAQKTDVLARYADGGAAVTRHKFGKGQAYVVGFYAGLEYCAPILGRHFNMATDFTQTRRNYVSAPALSAGVRPVVHASEPLVEGVLVKNEKSGRLAVALMNWAYSRSPVPEKKSRRRLRTHHVKFENLYIRIRGIDGTKTVRSAALNTSLRTTRDDGQLVIRLPLLEEVDILLLEPQ